MKQGIVREVKFHGELFKDKFGEGFPVAADSMFALWKIITDIYPELLKEQFTVAFEDENGLMTDLIDEEQELLATQKTLHILPNPDGAYAAIVMYIIIIIISVGLALLLAPKAEIDTDSDKGSNWNSAENVVGQGGPIPVVLGRRRVGSRVCSHGIGSVVFAGSASQYG